MKKIIFGLLVLLLTVSITNIHAQNDAGYEANEHGVAALNSGDYDRAISLFNEAIKLAPNNPFGYYNRGSAYFNMSDFDRAIMDFTQVIRMDANFIDAYYSRGYCYMYKLQFARAITDFEAVLLLDPYYLDIRESLSLARAMQAMGQKK